MRAVAHADLRSAFALNPWAILIIAQAAVVATWIAAAPDQAMMWWHQNLTRVLGANMVVGLALWGVRMGAGAIPTPFT